MANSDYYRQSRRNRDYDHNNTTGRGYSRMEEGNYGRERTSYGGWDDDDSYENDRRGTRNQYSNDNNQRQDERYYGSSGFNGSRNQNYGSYFNSGRGNSGYYGERNSNRYGDTGYDQNYGSSNNQQWENSGRNGNYLQNDGYDSENGYGEDDNPDYSRSRNWHDDDRYIGRNYNREFSDRNGGNSYESNRYGYGNRYGNRRNRHTSSEYDYYNE